jgi:hypothetical protein
MDQLLLYTSIGKNEDYIKLLELFCESLCTTNPYVKNLLVISDVSFHSRVRDILSKYAMLKYYILDQPDSMTPERASTNKLNIFDFPHIFKYRVCLFVDLDCLFLDNLRFIFDSPIEDNKLYVYAERDTVAQNKVTYFSLTNESGKYSYYNEADFKVLEKYSKLPFNAGFFLFRVSDTMKRHFDTLNEFVRSYKGNSFYEQSYMNTYFHLTNVSDTNRFTKSNIFMINGRDISDCSPPSHKIIHFNEEASNATIKYERMTKFWVDAKSKLKINKMIFPTRNEMIKHLIPYYATVLEIGVFKGEFAEIIASRIPSTLHLVDIWEEAPMTSGDQDGNNVIHIPNAFDMFKGVSHRFRFDKNIQIHRMSSSTFLKRMKPNSLDIAYVDGDPSYEGVKSDLEALLPCIRKYGWIMGHDYEMNMEKAKHIYDFGVKRAVDEFCEKHGYSISAKGMDGCVSYAIFIDHK